MRVHPVPTVASKLMVAERADARILLWRLVLASEADLVFWVIGVGHRSVMGGLGFLLQVARTGDSPFAAAVVEESGGASLGG